MNLQQLTYVVETVRCGSINEAARRLYLSQPSLSAAIASLEQELGITIFRRCSRGVLLTEEGEEFLGYARQAVEQIRLLEYRYKTRRALPRLCSISTQHYAFAVTAFVRLVKEYGGDAYELTLRETRTAEIISDVRNLRSEVGVLYLSEFNRPVILRALQDARLTFTPIYHAKPHVFLSSAHPLAGRASVKPEELEPYPCLSFEQGMEHSVYFAEEIRSTVPHSKNIRVSDRATLFNLLVGLSGYTISTGILSEKLGGDDIVAVPLEAEETMTVGIVENARTRRSEPAEHYIRYLREAVSRSSAGGTAISAEEDIPPTAGESAKEPIE